MSRLLIRFRLLPNDVAVKAEDVLVSISQRLPQGVKIVRSSEEPIAFGLVALIVELVCEERPDLVEALESSLKSSRLVGQADMIGISRASTTLS